MLVTRASGSFARRALISYRSDGIFIHITLKGKSPSATRRNLLLTSIDSPNCPRVTLGNPVRLPFEPVS
jgi:hypothetical protein